MSNNYKQFTNLPVSNINNRTQTVVTVEGYHKKTYLCIIFLLFVCISLQVGLMIGLLNSIKQIPFDKLNQLSGLTGDMGTIMKFINEAEQCLAKVHVCSLS
jgi:hypothetical protein